MGYIEEWNQKLKQAGLELGTAKTDQKARSLSLYEEIQSIGQEVEERGIFWPFWEAVNRLELSFVHQILLCILWSRAGRGMLSEDFLALYRTLTEQMEQKLSILPAWFHIQEDKVWLSPVLHGWLEGTVPELPEAAELIIPRKEKSYGLEHILSDAEAIFQTVEETQRPAILCMEGEEGSGRQFCMEQICAAHELTLLLLDADRFHAAARELNECVLCARLFDAFVCVRLGKEIRSRLFRDLQACFLFYGVIKNTARILEENPEAVVYTRKIAGPDRQLKLLMAKEQLGEWAEQLPAELGIPQLIGKQLPTGTFLRYIRTIRAELEAGTMHAAQFLTPTVSSSLNLLPATRTFEELKLPGAQYEQLRQISRMIAAREEVLSQWGFAEKFSYGNGMSLLFYGAPGTGKTMAAQVMAHELGMPLYRVDLSQLISKYIGETQKNIGRIFDEADKCDCILLFDEADAIFAKRSDVSDAQDRYSNAETAYLLQRIEQYAGVSILATNLLQNFDEAFRRRISYMVHFPMPDMTLRKELWDSIFPSATPVSSEVDTLALAQAFELSGASIKNAALHGALLARAEGSEVRMKHLLSGIRNEYGKQGKAFSSSQKELLDAYV